MQTQQEQLIEMLKDANVDYSVDGGSVVSVSGSEFHFTMAGRLNNVFCDREWD